MKVNGETMVLLQIKKLVDLMNSSVKTTTAFQTTGGVIAKMTAVIIQMKKTVVSNTFLGMLRADLVHF